MPQISVILDGGLSEERDHSRAAILKAAKLLTLHVEQASLTATKVSSNSPKLKVTD